MRVSSNPEDRGHDNYDGPFFRVFLDGTERDGILTADEEERMVVMVMRGESGQILVDHEKGEVRTEILYGDVRIERKQ